MLLERIRSIAITLSFPFDKNLAVAGESGSSQRISGVKATVIQPRKIKILNNSVFKYMVRRLRNPQLHTLGKAEFRYGRGRFRKTEAGQRWRRRHLNSSKQGSDMFVHVYATTFG